MTKDINTLSYCKFYNLIVLDLGITRGVDDTILDKIRDSDEDEGDNSDDYDSYQKRLFCQNPVDKQ